MKVFSYYELLRPSTIQMGLQIVAPRTMYQYITRIRMGDFTTRAEEGSIVPTSCRTYTRQQRRVCLTSEGGGGRRNLPYESHLV